LTVEPGYAIVVCEVHCDWQHEPPRYRLFVNDELFVERKYVWRGEYLEEMIPIWTSPGDYCIDYRLVPGYQGTLSIKNMRLQQGPPGATVFDNRTLRIPA
jgi:hypothetical protein